MDPHALSEASLRAMIREILREAVQSGRPPGHSPAAAPQPVRIATDADLQGFIARLASPGAIEAVRAGTLRFTLAAAPQTSAPAQVVLEGVVSERKLSGLAAGQHVVLAPGAVLTPLAKDLARQMRLRFERRG